MFKYVVSAAPWSWQWRWAKLRFQRGRFVVYREGNKTWADWEWEDD